MAASSSGSWERQAALACARRCWGIRSRCNPWPGARMEARWPVAAGTRGGGGGMGRPATVWRVWTTGTAPTLSSGAWPGVQMVSATLGRGVLVWEVRAGALRWIGRELPIWFRRVAWSPDGTQLASGGGSQDSGELIVWDARSGERLSALQGLMGAVYAVAWHPVGKLLISGGSDGRLCWWDLPSGACVRMREAHQGIVQALKVSPDGRRLASCGKDGTIRLWDLETGHALSTLRRDRPYERLTITGIQGLTHAEIATLRALGAVQDEADEQSRRPSSSRRG